MTDREMIAVFHYDDGGSNRLGAEPYRYAEEIIRCKECKHRDKMMPFCLLFKTVTEDNGYCYKAEREGE